MPPIIRVENLGKKYTIRHEHPERYTALRDVLAERARKLFSFPARLRHAANRPETDYEEFWALKDINFEVQPGDRVGIIGRNGAGKSTLLKILSRITEPTTGRIELNGRVASLLEVGTGFHPELTGRENIFLNGAILGMSRAEIRRKFDEIVDFSGVEKFLDTPVKRYSSGMYVRLAFAVAAHLEPEILVVDEVLAVGDAEFQKKCLGKMEEVSTTEGKTILFVSHNLGMIQRLCRCGLLLAKGKIVQYGNIDTVIEQYIQSDQIPSSDNSSISFAGLSLNPIRCTPSWIRSGGTLTIAIHLAVQDQCQLYDAALLIYTQSGIRVGVIDLKSHIPIGKTLRQDNLILNIEVRHIILVEGTYYLGIYLNSNKKQGDVYNLGEFVVEPADPNVLPPVSFNVNHRGLVNFIYTIENATLKTF